MKKLNKVKLPKWLLSVLGVVLIGLEYILYVHDRIVMSWTAKTMVNLKLWNELELKKQYALGRFLIIWGIYGAYKLIIIIF